MKIATPDPATLRAATQGDLAALDGLLRGLQPGIFNLALRMLGRREDAADATQEILLKVTTHLAGFRAEAAFTTWVFQIARNHLLTASAQARGRGEVSFEALAEKLQAGLDFAATLPDAGRALTPEEKAGARETGLRCTQGMLMALDPDHRLAYVLDLLFGLDSAQAGAVLGVSAAAYRQRLARARARLEGFAQRTCGLADAQAACRCETQQRAIVKVQRRSARAPSAALTATPGERAEAERTFGALLRLGDAAAVFRAHPAYQAPEALLGAIRTVLQAEGFGAPAPPLQ